MLGGFAVRTVFGGRRESTETPSLDAAMDARLERGILVVLLVVAGAVRIVGWDSLITPVFWFSQVPTLHVGRMLERGELWSTWLRQLQLTQVGWSHESVILLPIVAGLQWWLGPRFGLPVLSGALAGTASVLLAWALGRRMRSQAFGLVFAAFVAFSPMQLTWARLGPYYIGAIPHLLAAMLVGHCAGMRSSLRLAALAAVVAWTSVYEYYAARVAIPLSAVSMLAATARSTPLSRRALLLGVWTTVFVALAAATSLRTTSVRAAFWPAYGGYAGNRGETTLREFVERNWAGFREEARLVPERYFRDSRTSPSAPGYAPGMQNGGLCPLPIALLGAVGLLVVARRPRSQSPWLVVALAGLALPIASVTTSRRLLVFDLAWCAFAAHGLLAVVDGLASVTTRRFRGAAVACATVLIATWSCVAVFALDARVPAGADQAIPFGESGFGDGATCRRCVDAATEWRRDIAGGDFIVLFDNDGVRENRMSPGGLRVYGKIAAVAAGKPDAFIEAYGAMADWDGEAPTPGAIYDPDATDFASYLIERIERAEPKRIVWQFERPTPWERWLARRLVDVGGASEDYATALSSTPGLRVTTPWDRRDGAFEVVRDLAVGWWPEEDTPCVSLTERSEAAVAGPVFVLAMASGATPTARPVWLTASWQDVRIGDRSVAHPTLAAAVPDVPTEPIELFGDSGRRRAMDRTSGELTVLEPWPGKPIGYNCAARVDGAWWTVDPLNGVLSSPRANAAAVPDDPWIGVAGAGQRLVLASAEQSVVVFDTRTGRVTRRFPATVSPSVRQLTDECSQIAVGADWIATIDVRTGVASFYADDGRALGTQQLAPTKNPGEMVTAFAGVGRYLGVGTAAGKLWIAEVHIDPACLAPANRPREATRGRAGR